MIPEEITVIVVDDQKLFRDGMISILKPYNIKVIAEAENGLQLIELLKKIKVDVVLLDLEMKGLDGNKTMDAVRNQFPDIKIIIVSGYDDEELVKYFFNRGASAYIPKDTGENIMVEAIRVVKAEGTYKDNLPALKLRWKRSAKKYYYKLKYSRKEREVISLLCISKTNAIIANDLYISTKTVETHLSSIYKKANVTSRSAFLEYAFKQGLNYLGTFPAT